MNVLLVIVAVLATAVTTTAAFTTSDHALPLTVSPPLAFTPPHPTDTGIKRTTTTPKWGTPSSLSLSSGEEGEATTQQKWRYLGSGTDAIVRPGAVLVAPDHEYDHFLMRSAVFIFAIGLDEFDETVVRGVILDHPTAFTVGEMSPSITGTLANNQIYRGGRIGKNVAMLLHSAGGDDEGGPSVGTAPEIGGSGVYEGGSVEAMDAANNGSINKEDCKFFFNYMEFGIEELDEMFAATEDGDSWVSLELPSEWVLDSDLDRGQLWTKLRKHLRDGGFIKSSE